MHHDITDSDINLSSESERKEKGKFIRRFSCSCEQPLKVGRFCLLLFVMKKNDKKNNYFKYESLGFSDDKGFTKFLPK